MTFGNIYWLYAFLPVLVILLIGFFYLQNIRKAFFKSFVAPPLIQNLLSSFCHRRYYFKSILFLLAAFFIFLALAQPRWGYTWKEQKAKGIDILFALDISKSMLAEDIKPNRLQRAKYSIQDLVKKLEGNRFGLVAFAGTAFLQCPLTLDYNAFLECLEQTDPSILYRGGTDIAAAIRTALPAFSIENNFKILILISDGEEFEESGLSEAQSASRDNNLVIYTVGVGTATGELIPITTENNSIDYMRDSEGRIVKTKLDESNLKKIAEATKGFYVPLGAKGEGLEAIYQSSLSKIPKQELSSSLQKVPVEQFQWPLAIAIFLLILNICLSTRRKQLYPIANYLFAVLLLNLVTNSVDASGSSGYKAFQAGKFKEAINLYEIETKKETNNSVLHYNLGTSFYKDQNYDASIVALNNAVKTQDLSLQQKAFYNIGNSLYRKGEQSLETNPQQTVQLWEEALKNYQSAIELNPLDKECKENIEFVKKNVEKIKNKQQENKNNKENKQDPSKDNEESQNKDKEAINDNKNENSPKENSLSEHKDAESPPDEEKKEDEKKSSGNHNNEDQKASNNSNSKKSNTEDTKVSSNTSKRMTQEAAEELLKSLKNSEQKLGAVSERSNNTKENSDNFKDW